MDAKPHRPSRSLAAQPSRNENLPVKSVVGISKQLDAQTSYPPYLHAGGVKATTKRSAFGDLSNTAAHRHVKYTSKPALKMAPSSANDKENAALAVNNGKSKAAFLRPPQRPANGLKPASNFQLPSDQRPQNAIKQTGARKTSVVYHDVQNQNPQTLTHKTTSQPHLESEETSVLRDTQNKQNVMEGLNFDKSVDQGPIDVPYEDAQEAVEAPDWIHDSYPPGSRIPAAEKEPLPPSLPSPQHQQSLVDHDECWDEDEDEELYDDVAYTTAGSCKSYGDNTMGVAALMAPKQTAKVLRELEEARLYVKEFRLEEDIEDEDNDITMVAEYGDEIFDYQRTLEDRMTPSATYMDCQVDVHWSMRSILMDWLVQVHNRFSLFPETLFLAVNLIDRFLSRKVISLGKLQLVGATAIFIAAKYEEISCPSVQEIVYMVDYGYSTDEILKAERFMLSMLDYELGWPGPMSFLRRISKADDYDLEVRTLAKYFLEVTIMDERFVSCPGSYIAAGAHSLARAILRKGDWVSRDLLSDTVNGKKLKSVWTPMHVHFSGYTWSQLKPLVAMILECCHMATKHHRSVYEKYTDRRFKKSSIFVQEELQKGFKLPFQNAIPRLSLYGPTPENTAQMRFPPHPDNNALSAMLIATES